MSLISRVTSPRWEVTLSGRCIATPRQSAARVAVGQRAGGLGEVAASHAVAAHRRELLEDEARGRVVRPAARRGRRAG